MPCCPCPGIGYSSQICPSEESSEPRVAQAVVSYRAMGRGERGSWPYRGRGASHSVKIIRVGDVYNTDTGGSFVQRTAARWCLPGLSPSVSSPQWMMLRIMLDWTMTALWFLSNCPVSSGWRKTWPEAPPSLCNAGIIVQHFAPSQLKHHLQQTQQNWQ